MSSRAVYPFAITAGDWHAHAGHVSTQCIPDFLAALAARLSPVLPVCKLRWHARVVSAHAYVHFSSIAVFSTHAADDDDACIRARTRLATALRVALAELVCWREGQTVAVTPMPGTRDMAFVAKPSFTCFHRCSYENEWFQMPIADQVLTPVADPDACSPGCNLLCDHHCTCGATAFYDGNMHDHIVCVVCVHGSGGVYPVTRRSLRRGIGLDECTTVGVVDVRPHAAELEREGGEKLARARAHSRCSTLASELIAVACVHWGWRTTMSGSRRCDRCAVSFSNFHWKPWRVGERVDMPKTGRQGCFQWWCHWLASRHDCRPL